MTAPQASDISGAGGATPEAGAPARRREVVLDTETTGLSPGEGHRIVEVAALALEDGAAGEHFHVRINPGRDIPEEAVRVHGLTAERLADCPPFAKIAPDLLAFIGGDRLVIHNAPFDLAFLNAELGAAGLATLAEHPVVDTLAMARAQGFARASLDALCRHYGLDLSGRELHGALIDCRLLAQVYVRLTRPQGARPRRLSLRSDALARGARARASAQERAPPPPPYVPTAEEEAAFAAMLEAMAADGAAPLWRGLLRGAEAPPVAGRTAAKQAEPERS